jgi:hypothetical protein
VKRNCDGHPALCAEILLGGALMTVISVVVAEAKQGQSDRQARQRIPRAKASVPEIPQPSWNHLEMTQSNWSATAEACRRDKGPERPEAR